MTPSAEAKQQPTGKGSAYRRVMMAKTAPAKTPIKNGDQKSDPNKKIPKTNGEKNREKLRINVTKAVDKLEADVSSLQGDAGFAVDPTLMPQVEQQTHDARTKLTGAAKFKELKEVRTLAAEISDKVKVLRGTVILANQDPAAVEYARAIAAWKSKWDAASKTLDDLKALPTCDTAECEGILKKIGDEVQKQDAAASYQLGVTALERDFPPAAERARKDAEQTRLAREQTRVKVDEVETTLQKVELLADYCDPQEARDAVGKARKEFNAAKNAQQFKTVAVLANEAAAKVQAALLDAKPCLNAERDYEQAEQTATASLTTMRSLPCADTFGPIKAAITKAETVMADAKLVVSGPKEKAKFTSAKEILGGVETHLATAQTAAQEPDSGNALQQLKKDAAKKLGKEEASPKVLAVLEAMQTAETGLKELKESLKDIQSDEFKFNQKLVVIEKKVNDARDNLSNAKDVAESQKAAEPLKDALKEIKEVKDSEGYVLVKQVRDEEAHAKSRLEKMQALPGAGTFGPLVEKIKETRAHIDMNRASKAANKDQLKQFVQNLLAVEKMKVDAKELSAKGEELLKKLAKADAAVTDLERHAFLNVAELRADYKKVHDEFQNADKLADSKNALTGLDTLDHKMKRMRESKEAELKQRGKFDEARLAAREHLAEVEQLRGADTDDQLKQIVADMRQNLSLADKDASVATTVAELEAAAKKVESFEKDKKEAQKRVPEVKQELENDLKAQPSYAKQLIKARKAAATATGLPGADSQVTSLNALIQMAENLIKSDGKMTRGYAAAVKLLEEPTKGYAALLKLAQSAPSQFKPDARVVPAVAEANTKIAELEKLASTERIAEFRAQLAAVQQLSTKDADAALMAIGDLDKTTENEKARLTHVAAQVRANLTLAEDLHQQIKDFAPKIVIASLDNTLKRLKTTEIPGRHWDAALEALSPRIKEAEAWSGMRSSFDEWTLKAKDWEATLQRVNVIADSCPPLLQKAARIKLNLTVLKLEVKATGEYRQGVKSFDDLKIQVDKLEQEARTQVPHGVDLKALAEARKKSQENVTAVNSKVMFAIWQFERVPEVVAVKNKDKIKINVDHQKVLANWQAFIGSGTTTDVNGIRAEETKTVNDLEALLATLKKMETDAAAKAEQLDPAIAADADAAVQDRAGNVDRLLAQLVHHQVDVGADQQKFADLRKVSLPDQKELEKLERDLAGKVQQAQAAQNQRIDETKKLKAEAEKKVQAKIKKRGAFRPLYQKMETKLDDLDTLLDSGDPELIRQGIAETEQLRANLLDKARAKRFKEVKTQWKKASALLGKEVLKKMRKQTYNNLKAELNATIAKAMESEPDEGLKELEALTKKINEALEEAEKVKQQYEEFKKERKAIKKLYKKLVETTRAGVGETVKETTVEQFTDANAGRVEALYAKLQVQLGEADELATTEGKDSMPAARQKLQAIRGQLEAIRDDADPRGKLQEANGKAKQEQRLSKDMAEQFNAELASCEKAIVEAEKRVKERKEDPAPIDMLRQGAEGAALIVEPYTNAVSGWPHKKLQGQAADPPEKVAQAFSVARKQLADLTRAANQLAKDSTSTEVDDSKELIAIQLEVEDRAKKLRKAVADLIDEVKKAADAWPTPLPADAPKDALNNQEAADTYQKLTAYFSDINKRFSLQPIRRPLEILTDSTTDQSARKGAREKAIRHIHYMVQDLLRDEVLKELRKNPYRALAAETSLLRASLKSLELAVLVGI